MCEEIVAEVRKTEDEFWTEDMKIYAYE